MTSDNLTSKGFRALPPIDDLLVIDDPLVIPIHYHIDHHDLNEGTLGDAGGRRSLFFIFRTNPTGEEAITDIKMIYGKFPIFASLPQTPSGQPYHIILKDLNQGVGGEYIFACITRDSSAGAPIRQIQVISGSTSDIEPEHPFERIDLDLNLGAGGKYIYLCYSRDDGGAGM